MGPLSTIINLLFVFFTCLFSWTQLNRFLLEFDLNFVNVCLISIIGNVLLSSGHRILSYGLFSPSLSWGLGTGLNLGFQLTVTLIKDKNKKQKNKNKTQTNKKQPSYSNKIHIANQGQRTKNFGSRFYSLENKVVPWGYVGVASTLPHAYPLQKYSEV